MNDRASHRAAVEAGYADLAGYVAKYRDERPSLHGDGHVGPVAEHTARAARETSAPSIHDLLEARPLHASAYEPLTPFKPREPRNSTEEAILTRIKDPRKIITVLGGDQISGRLHDDRS